jgi:hypothetical protein
VGTSASSSKKMHHTHPQARPLAQWRSLLVMDALGKAGGEQAYGGRGQTRCLRGLKYIPLVMHTCQDSAHATNSGVQGNPAGTFAHSDHYRCGSEPNYDRALMVSRQHHTAPIIRWTCKR